MKPARRVRATVQFFEDLDKQMRHKRGPNGEPSANDFQIHDLFRIIERFADEWDTLPELIPGRPDYRILIGTGIVVSRFAVIGQLANDDAVELVQLDGERRRHRRHRCCDSEYLPVALIDDNAHKAKRKILGVPMAGNRSALPTVFTAYGADVLLIAMPSAVRVQCTRLSRTWLCQRSTRGCYN